MKTGLLLSGGMDFLGACLLEPRELSSAYAYGTPSLSFA